MAELRTAKDLQDALEDAKALASNGGFMCFAGRAEIPWIEQCIAWETECAELRRQLAKMREPVSDAERTKYGRVIYAEGYMDCVRFSDDAVDKLLAARASAGEVKDAHGS